MIRLCRCIFIVVGLPILVAGACDNAPSSAGGTPQTGLRTIPLKIGSRDFTLEVADTEPTRNIGMMFRDSVSNDHGMLFVFATNRPLGFYMKNCRISLDILFLDDTMKVVAIKTMLAYDMRSVGCESPCKYAIELGAGVASEIGVKVGDKLAIPPEAQTTDK